MQKFAEIVYYPNVACNGWAVWQYISSLAVIKKEWYWYHLVNHSCCYNNTCIDKIKYIGYILLLLLLRNQFRMWLYSIHSNCPAIKKKDASNELDVLLWESNRHFQQSWDFSLW